MKPSSTLILGAMLALSACAKKAPPAQEGGLTPRAMADAMYAVMAADRAVYTREVVQRLQNEKKVIKATEHFRDENTLPLPAQMFRMGAEVASQSGKGFHYALLSSWAINKQNAPRTDLEKAGLEQVAKSGEPYYGEETLGGKKYFSAVYPDKAVSAACVTCHNDHPDSPRADFKEGDVMGGVVIRIATGG